MHIDRIRNDASPVWKPLIGIAHTDTDLGSDHRIIKAIIKKLPGDQDNVNNGIEDIQHRIYKSTRIFNSQMFDWSIYLKLQLQRENFTLAEIKNSVDIEHIHSIIQDYIKSLVKDTLIDQDQNSNSRRKRKRKYREARSQEDTTQQPLGEIKL